MRRLVSVALLLACLVVPLGAYVRLSDAGLGCPDWPLCYGKVSPHHASEAIAAAEASRPEGPVSQAKAWKEMIHRYAASTLGLLILGVAVLAWRRRRQRMAASLLLGLVVLQGLLGMWTVTLLLKPAIVTAHLLGGMLTVTALAAMTLVTRNPVVVGAGAWWAARLLPVAVLGQIMLGGWVSTNYAALACNGFPLCSGGVPDMHWGQAFHVWRELGQTPEGDWLPFAALVSIHWAHRLGAVLVTALAVSVLWLSRKTPGIGAWRLLLAASLVLQLGLGIANVLLQLPLPVAVAHNAGAMVLLVVSTVFSLGIRRAVPADSRTERSASWQS